MDDGRSWTRIRLPPGQILGLGKTSNRLFMASKSPDDLTILAFDLSH
jgi:hypothetical protein